MTTLLPHRPSLLFSTFSGPTRNPLARTTRFAFSNPRPALRGSLVVAARLGLGPDPFPEPELIADLFGRAEGFLYTLADAAVSAPASPEVVAAVKNDDWFSGIANYMESVLKVLKDGLSAVHVPYSYGFAIILLTILVKAATFPLTKKQVESAMAMRSLQPQIKAIQQRFAGDQERIQLETARLYKVVGINPLAGCLPTLATIPVWIGLYRALSNVADEGLLTEGFFWIPSLSGPTTVAARQSGSGVSWLFPFVDGHPPLGWSDTLAYLVLPVLLVVSQYISVQVMQSTQNTDPNQKSPPLVTKFLPLLIGYFSLSVPSGLSLYWLTNNILSTAQQVWLQKLGGAKIPASQITTDVEIEDNLEVPKAVLDLPLTPKSSQKAEDKKTTEGPRPGERFKQLKEAEERRKRQKEEEKGRAEEAIANGTRVTNRKSNETEVDFERKNTIHNSTNGANGNGSLSSQQSQENLGKEEAETYTSSTSRDKIPSEED